MAIRVFFLWFPDPLEPEYEEKVATTMDQFAYVSGMAALVTSFYGSLH